MSARARIPLSEPVNNVRETRTLGRRRDGGSLLGKASSWGAKLNWSRSRVKEARFYRFTVRGTRRTRACSKGALDQRERHQPLAAKITGGVPRTLVERRRRAQVGPRRSGDKARSSRKRPALGQSLATFHWIKGAYAHWLKPAPSRRPYGVHLAHGPALQAYSRSPRQAVMEALSGTLRCRGPTEAGSS